MYYGVGILAMIVCVWIVRLVRSWRIPVLLLIPLSLALLVLPLVIGRENERREKLVLRGGYFRPSPARS